MKKFIAGFVSAVILMSSVNATSTIQALLRDDIKIYFLGKEFTMKDEKWNTVYPITYNGTTYIPLRAFSEKIRLQTKWHEETKSIFVGSHRVTETAPFGEWFELDGLVRIKVNSVKVTSKRRGGIPDNTKTVVIVDYDIENINYNSLDGISIIPYPDESFAEFLRYPEIIPEKNQPTNLKIGEKQEHAQIALWKSGDGIPKAQLRFAIRNPFISERSSVLFVGDVTKEK